MTDPMSLNYQPRKRHYRSWLRCTNPILPKSTEKNIKKRCSRSEGETCNRTREHSTVAPSNNHSNTVQQASDLLTGDSLQASPSDEDSDSRGSFSSEENSGDMDESAGSVQFVSDSDELHYDSASSRHSLTSHDEGSHGGSDSDQEHYIPHLDELIHPSIKTTKFECLLMILSYAFRHNLTYVAIEDLCKMINCILGDKVIPVSKFMLKKIFGMGLNYSINFYCSSCTSYIAKMAQNSKRTEAFYCPVCREECNTKSLNDGYFFLTFPLEEQIKAVLEDIPDVLEVLKYRLNLRTQDNIISDIFNGQVYKKLTTGGGILSKWYNLSMTFNTDGAAVFDCCQNTLWPIYTRINALSPDIRFNHSNSMLSGIWFGKKEPNMSLYLSTFVEECNNLYKYGLKWKVQSGEAITSKVILLNCVVDLKAKPLIQNVKQFNGFFGCGYCTHPGVCLDGGNQAKYVMDDNIFLLEDYSATYTATKPDKDNKNIVFEVVDRSNEKMRADMEEVEKKRVEKGRAVEINEVKGKSVLNALVFFDIVSGFSVDYMHCVLLGVVKLVTGLWLDSSSHKEPYYIGREINALDERLLEIKPPTSISRRPRSIAERVHFKANEWRSWLLFYSLPCLKGILPTTYFKHHSLLVTSMNFFLKDQISRSELEENAWYVIEYVQGFQKLYGRQFMYYNVHLLLHIPKCVEMWGPLWCYSTFSFEASNVCLIKLAKGTKGIPSQIGDKYIMCRSVAKILKLYSVSDNVLEYCDNLTCYAYANTAMKINSVVLLGNQKTVALSQEEQETFLCSVYNLTNCTYERMIKNKILYHSRCYSRRGKKSDDSVVKLHSGTYGVIERITVLGDALHQNSKSILVMLRQVNIAPNEYIVTHTSTRARPYHIKVCSPLVYVPLRIVSADDSFRKAIMISCSDEEPMYLADFPNIYGKD